MSIGEIRGWCRRAAALLQAVDDDAAGMIGYIRVSTEEQDYGAAAQRKAIRSAARDRGWSLKFIEERVSGKRERRPGLDEALASLAAGDAEGLVVTKVDRLARSVRHLASILDTSQRQRWRLVFLDLGVDTGTVQGRFAVHIMSAMAELEGALISQRTREGVERARAAGRHVGRRSNVTPETRHLILKLYAEGVSMNEIARRLNEHAACQPRCTGRSGATQASARS